MFLAQTQQDCTERAAKSNENIYMSINTINISLDLPYVWHKIIHSSLKMLRHRLNKQTILSKKATASITVLTVFAYRIST